MFCSPSLLKFERVMELTMNQNNAFSDGYRYLKDKGRGYSILKDKMFTNCRKVLNGKAIELREKGMGKRKNKSDALTIDEEEQLWQLKVLGENNPKSLNYTIFYLLSQQFGTRGCQEHHQLRVEDLKFVHDPSGITLYVEWVEGLTKLGRED